jgi:hypothetical protein
LIGCLLLILLCAIGVSIIPAALVGLIIWMVFLLSVGRSSQSCGSTKFNCRMAYRLFRGRKWNLFLPSLVFYLPRLYVLERSPRLSKHTHNRSTQNSSQNTQCDNKVGRLMCIETFQIRSFMRNFLRTSCDQSDLRQGNVTKFANFTLSHFTPGRSLFPSYEAQPMCPKRS